MIKKGFTSFWDILNPKTKTNYFQLPSIPSAGDETREASVLKWIIEQTTRKDELFADVDLDGDEQEPVKPVKQVRTKEPKIMEEKKKAKSPSLTKAKPKPAPKPKAKAPVKKIQPVSKDDKPIKKPNLQPIQSEESSAPVPSKKQLPKPIQEQKLRFQMKKPNKTEEKAAAPAEDEEELEDEEEVEEEEEQAAVAPPEDQDEDATNVIDDSPNVVAFFCK